MLFQTDDGVTKTHAGNGDVRGQQALAAVGMFKLCLRVKPGFPPSLQDTCRKLHALIDKADEERYDLNVKVGKADKEVNVVSSCCVSVAALYTLILLRSGLLEVQCPHAGVVHPTVGCG